MALHSADYNNAALWQRVSVPTQVQINSAYNSDATNFLRGILKNEMVVIRPTALQDPVVSVGQLSTLLASQYQQVLGWIAQHSNNDEAVVRYSAQLDQLEQQMRDLKIPLPSENNGILQETLETFFIELPNTKIEFLHPLGQGSPITGFLEKNPSGGIHHICYEVDDILAARDQLIASGARVLGTGEPKIGAHGKPVLFLHPKDFTGTLVELEQV